MNEANAMQTKEYSNLGLKRLQTRRKGQVEAQQQVSGQMTLVCPFAVSLNDCK
jgi:hypothetical protein